MDRINTIQMTGCCMACGQTKLIEIDEYEAAGLDEEQLQRIADREATKGCLCKEGYMLRDKWAIIDECSDNIESMFRENYPYIADLFQEAKEPVYEHVIRKINVQTQDGSGTAVMYRKGKTIELKFAERKETTLATAAGLA